MKKSTLIFIIFFIFSCNKKRDVVQQIFDRSLNTNEINSIDIVEINHPMLGEVIHEKKLSGSQKKHFLKNLNSIKYKGIYKCAAKYIIRFNLNDDTLRLKICGSLIANRFNDEYYEFPKGKNSIDQYLFN